MDCGEENLLAHALGPLCQATVTLGAFCILACQHDVFQQQRAHIGLIRELGYRLAGECQVCRRRVGLYWP